LRRIAAFLLITCAAALAGCSGDEAKPAGKATPKRTRREVIVYTALDRQFSEPILKEFEERTGIEVRPVFDAEAVKTVGLVNRIIAERARPQCDVFWNNEVLRSIQLNREGVVEAYVSPSAADIPDKFKDPTGAWTGFAARARVFRRQQRSKRQTESFKN
jgi:iron(III) transport system substrate-binding protein